MYAITLCISTIVYTKIPNGCINMCIDYLELRNYLGSVNNKYKFPCENKTYIQDFYNLLGTHAYDVYLIICTGISSYYLF